MTPYEETITINQFPSCGCGKQTRYMVAKDGELVGSCNKFLRCLTYDEQGEALKRSNSLLLDLLSLIHRDGGGHSLSVGLEQSIDEAKKTLYRWREAYDDLD